MHDLRLVGVHDDGEHLVLVDGQGERYLLDVDEALHAAVRRDRAHLGQLQIEIEGGLRPRDVQARIRAGASAEEVASLAGWSVEKVRRYEGPVLAERAHVADRARAVRLRRRAGESVTLGAEATRRLVGRGIDADAVSWDSWRGQDGPWTVVASFTAGGRERQARWHFDPAAGSVVPADDEARWLSEESAPDSGPLAGSRLAAVRGPGVYDIEADGGVGTRTMGAAGQDGGALDLVGAMRSRRRERDSRPGGGRRDAATPSASPSSSAGSKTTNGTGSSHGAADIPGSNHPARRRRQRPEPLELDPALMDDPPAAHPQEPQEQSSQGQSSQGQEPQESPEQESPEQEAATGTPGRWPLAAHMRQLAPFGSKATRDQDAGQAAAVGPRENAPSTEVLPSPEGTADPASLGTPQPADDEAPSATNGRQRPTASKPSRGRRSSVPSWDDIMFGAKRDGGDPT